MRLSRAFFAAVVVAAALGLGSASAAPDSGRSLAAAADESIWSGAGAFVMTEGNVDPRTLAQQLKANNFRWAAFLLHDGLTADPIDAAWIQRFRQAAGGAVLLGGWGVNREQPESEAALAAQLVDRYDLAFYIANAELEYKYSGDDGYSPERWGRSRRFVEAFRARKPGLTAAVSSFCHAKNHDIDWAVWRDAGFDFLPQAYANDFGADFGPDKCAESAAAAFPMDRVHPTVGTYPSAFRVSPEQYVTMLSRSATTGFSLYLAEVDMTAAKWKAYGRAARAEVGAAAWPVPDKCAESAAAAFPMDRVHPTVGTYPSAFRVSPEQYVTMLSRSASTGFSLYLAEVDMTAAKWKAYGRAARAEVGAAAWPVPDTRPIVQTTGLVPPPVLTLYTGATVPVTSSGQVTLHFFATRAGKVRLDTGGAPTRTIPIRAGQNLLRVALPGAGSSRARRSRPTHLQLTAISPTGLQGKTWVLKLRYGGG